MKSTNTNPEKIRTGWTDGETASLAGLYFRMRALDHDGKLGRGKGRTSKKSLVVAWIAEQAPGRSHGSVEAKLMNISASCAEAGIEQVKGYKALPNRTRSMDAIVWKAAEAFASLLLLVALAA